MAKYSTPRVPIQTPMFDEQGLLTRTWVIFFERLGNWFELSDGGGGGTGALTDLYHRTLLVKDSTPGADIADHVTVYHDGTAQRFVGVLRLAITSDLEVTVNVNGSALITITIPSATAVDTPVESTTFAGDVNLHDGDVLSWDILSSDSQVDAAGVASFTLEWK